MYLIESIDKERRWHCNKYDWNCSVFHSPEEFRDLRDILSDIFPHFHDH